jgi:hypothetical protein
MSEEKQQRQVFKMSDDLIAMVRELVQLSFLTGTNIVDHFRAVQMEQVEGKPLFLTVTPEYVAAYNDMVQKLNEAALKRQEEMQKTVAVEE